MYHLQRCMRASACRCNCKSSSIAQERCFHEPVIDGRCDAHGLQAQELARAEPLLQ